MSASPVPAPPRVRSRARRAAGLVLLAPVLAVVLATASAAPAAASPACPTSPDRVRLTWGVSGPDADVRTTTGRFPARSVAIDPGARRSGLGLGLDPEVRTGRTARGTGRPVLCAGGKVRARLPLLGRGTVVGAASANGSWLAWRTAKRGALGRVSVGQVVGGRLRAVRSRQTVRGVAGQLVNGNLVVTDAGTVVWTVGPGPQGRDQHSVGAVWPRGAEVTPVPVPDRPSEQSSAPLSGRSIFVTDDHAVQVDGHDTTPVAYRVPVPGSCPRIVDGRTTSFAGWEVSRTFVTTISGPRSASARRGYLVCDPATGRTFAVGGVGSTGFGASTSDTVRLIARKGAELYVEHDVVDPFGFARFTVDVVDATTGATRTVPGWLEVPGGSPPPATPVVDPSATAPGVTVAPGADVVVGGPIGGPADRELP